MNNIIKHINISIWFSKSQSFYIDLIYLNILWYFSTQSDPYFCSDALIISSGRTLPPELSFFLSSSMEVIYYSSEDFSRFYLFSLWLLTEGHEAEKVPGIGLGKFNMSGIFVACWIDSCDSVKNFLEYFVWACHSSKAQQIIGILEKYLSLLS